MTAQRKRIKLIAEFPFHKVWELGFDLPDAVTFLVDFFLEECFSFSPYNPTFQSVIDDFEFLPFMS